ncbi:MAG: hypothetical protein K6A38_07600 [Lachnospiraceae bacterium]|nr:hypothetical protein [Lachnospiraceae bacterium]
MNKKVLAHALTITAIVIAAFTAAALTPVKTNAATHVSSVMNIAKVDFETRTDTEGKIIADNEIPLASAPEGSDFNITLWIAVVSAATLMSGIVIYEEHKYKKNGRY